MVNEDHDALNAARLAAVQDSFAIVYAQAKIHGARVYVKLWQRCPELRHVLGDDPTVHAERLMDMINVIVTGMGHTRAMLPLLRNLSMQHSNIGVQARHYVVLGQIIMDVLEDALGSAHFGPFVRESWESGYSRVCRVMIQSSSEDRENLAKQLTDAASSGLAPARASSY